MADRALPDLVGRTRLDNRQLKRDAAQAKGEIAGIGKGAQGTGNIIEGAFGKASSSLTSRLGPASGIAQKALDGIGSSALKSGNLMQTAFAGGAAAAAVGVAALATKGVTAFVQLGQKVRDFDRVAGAGAETSSRFVSVLDDMGIEAETGAKAVSKLSRSLDTAGLDKFGVDIEHARDGSVDLVGTIENISDAYVGLSDPTQKAELRFAAFGKQGDALIPILEKGGKAVREMFAGVPTGELFDQRKLDQVEDFRLAMDRLEDAVGNLQRNLGGALVPIITDIADAFSGLIETADKVTGAVGGIEGVVGAAAKTITGPLSAASDIIHGKFKKGLVEAVPLVGPFAQGLFNIGEGGKKAADGADENADAQQDAAASMEEAAEQADAEAKAIDRLSNAQVSLVDSTLGLTGSQQSYEKALADFAEVAGGATKATKEHADATLTTAERQVRAADASKRLAAAQAEVASQERNLIAARAEAGPGSSEEAQVLDALAAAHARESAAKRDLTAATSAAIGPTKESATVTKGAATNSLEYREAMLKVEEAASRQARAVADLKEQQAIANGETFTAEQKTAAYKQALIDAGNQAKGPVKQAILDLAATIKSIDDVKRIAVELVGEEKVKADLLEIGRMLNATLPKLGIPIQVPLPGRMAGGPVTAGQPYVVGERRPELFIPNVSGRIVPRVPQGWGMNGPGVAVPSGGSYVIQVPVVIDGREVARSTVRFTSQELEKYRVDAA